MNEKQAKRLRRQRRLEHAISQVGEDAAANMTVGQFVSITSTYGDKIDEDWPPKPQTVQFR